MKCFLSIVALVANAIGASSVSAAENKPTAIATDAVNSLGLELLAKGTDTSKNAVISPYSIQLAMAMCYVGAAGDTRTEMAKVLHFPDDSATLQKSFATLADSLRRPPLGAADPNETTVKIANRLFGQADISFREPAMTALKDGYNAPLERLNFKTDSAGCAKTINGWVSEQTAGNIPEVVPPGALDRLTRLVLVNAIYFKDSWSQKFDRALTEPLAFHVNGGAATTDVPALKNSHAQGGYEKRDGYTVATLFYRTPVLQFVIIVPDDIGGLPKLEASLTPEILATFARLPAASIDIRLPKFKFEPPIMPLKETLQSLGMNAAFDKPKGSADFDGFAPKSGPDALYISDVFHRAMIAVNEEGTVGAAATAVVMKARGMARPAQPVKLSADRPFIFLVQDRVRGECLFIGRVVEPKWEGKPDEAPDGKPQPKPAPPSDDKPGKPGSTF